MREGGRAESVNQITAGDGPMGLRARPLQRRGASNDLKWFREEWVGEAGGVFVLYADYQPAREDGQKGRDRTGVGGGGIPSKLHDEGGAPRTGSFSASPTGRGRSLCSI